MKPFSIFYPDLLPQVPACPEPVADLALLRAAQRFCEITRAWRAVMDPIFLIEGIDAYDIELPKGAELVRLDVAKVDGQDIPIVTTDEATQRCRDYIYCPDGRQLFINPVPKASRTLSLTGSFKPSDAATGVEDFIAAEYRDLIAKGASGRLKIQPAKTYTDPQMGAALWMEFESDCYGVRERARRGFGRVPPRVVPHFF